MFRHRFSVSASILVPQPMCALFDVRENSGRMQCPLVAGAEGNHDCDGDGLSCENWLGNSPRSKQVVRRKPLATDKPALARYAPCARCGR